MTNAYKYVKAKGMLLEDEYPYSAREEPCKAEQGGPFKISGYNEGRTCVALSHAITERPISVSVDAGPWHSYSSGVLNKCGTHHNHGVTLVGVKDGAWWAKNSWGFNWG